MTFEYHKDEQEFWFSSHDYKRNVSELEINYHTYKHNGLAKKYGKIAVPVSIQTYALAWLFPLKTWDQIAQRKKFEKEYLNRYPTEHLEYDFKGFREEIEETLNLKKTDYELSDYVFNQILTATNMYAPQLIQATHINDDPLTLKMYPLDDEDRTLVIKILA